MSRLDNQRRLFLELIETLRPHWRRDPGLPARIQRWLATHRAGSRDRRLYRELAYTALRVLPWIEHASPDEVVGIVAACAAPSPATEAFITAYALDPLPTRCEPALLLPAWLADECPAALAPVQRAALLTRAPLWVRLQHTSTAAAVGQELTAGGWRSAPSTVLPSAWRIEGDGDLTQTAAYRGGHIEIQDLGSQLLLETVRPALGEHWLDACAGAGGKTLQLAGMLGPAGTVVAHDIRPGALQELATRASRAGFRTVSTRSTPPSPGTQFDGVLVDAPCTGSGTWRRAPHLKWTTGADTIARAARRQRQLLDHFSGFVKPGGRLVYATCSLCRSENEAVVETFLDTHKNFQSGPLHPAADLRPGLLGLAILPADVDSDAFFVSALQRG
jgi:16S rRNA (cytosine967-C5)-methyltransferase